MTAFYFVGFECCWRLFFLFFFSPFFTFTCDALELFDKQKFLAKEMKAFALLDNRPK